MRHVESLDFTWSRMGPAASIVLVSSFWVAVWILDDNENTINTIKSNIHLHHLLWGAPLLASQDLSVSVKLLDYRMKVQARSAINRQHPSTSQLLNVEQAQQAHLQHVQCRKNKGGDKVRYGKVERLNSRNPLPIGTRFCTFIFPSPGAFLAGRGGERASRVQLKMPKSEASASQILAGDIVDGWNPASQLRLGSLSHYFQGFIRPRWLFGISEPSTVPRNRRFEHLPTSQDLLTNLNIPLIWEPPWLALCSDLTAEDLRMPGFGFQHIPVIQKLKHKKHIFHLSVHLQ